MNKNYYIYIYYRLDTNEPFYVGKGKGRRWKQYTHKRNKHFINIINKYPISVVIEKDNLAESEAFYWEEEIIRILVFEYGYSIDINNNYSKEKGMHLVNCTWGGEGSSGYKFSKEQNKKHSERVSGDKNPMFGKNARDYSTKEILKERDKKVAEANKKRWQDEEYRIRYHEKMSGKNSPQAKSVICLTTKRIFYTSIDGAKYYKCSSGEIFYCCQGFRMRKGKKAKVKSAGKLPDGTPLVWRRLIWNHDKRYRIIND